MVRSGLGLGVLLVGIVAACAPTAEPELGASEEGLALQLSATDTAFLPNDFAIDAAFSNSAPKGFMFEGGSGNRVVVDLVPDSPGGVSELLLYGPQLDDGRWPSAVLARGTSRVQARLGNRGAYLAVARGFGRFKAILRGAVSTPTITSRLTGYVLGESARDDATARASVDRECRLWQDDMKRLVEVPGVPDAPTALRSVRCEPQLVNSPPDATYQYEARPVAELAVPRVLGSQELRLSNVRGSELGDVFTAYQSWQRACQSAVADLRARTQNFVAAACEVPRLESTWGGRFRYTSSAGYLTLRPALQSSPDGVCSSFSEDCYSAPSDCACAAGKCMAVLSASNGLAGRCAQSYCGDRSCNPQSENRENCPSDCPEPMPANSTEMRLRASNGSYVVAEGGGGGAINANRPAAGPWERFYLVDHNGGSIDDGDEVTLRTNDGWYVRPMNGGGSTVDALSMQIGPWERLRVEKPEGGSVHSGDSIAFRTPSGHYLVAEGGGGREVRANRTARGPWETFVVEIP